MKLYLGNFPDTSYWTHILPNFSNVRILLSYFGFVLPNKGLSTSKKLEEFWFRRYEEDDDQ